MLVTLTVRCDLENLEYVKSALDQIGENDYDESEPYPYGTEPRR